jgi:hypothetical protein
MKNLRESLERLRDQAGPTPGGFDRLRRRDTKRRMVRRTATIAFSFLIFVAGAFGAVVALRDREVVAHVGAGSSLDPTPSTEACAPDVERTWKHLMVPWLTSVLTDVGAPEGLSLSDAEIVDTGSALEILPESYIGRMSVYVHAGVPDPEHDPTSSMHVLRAGLDFTLYFREGDTTQSYVAEGGGVWVSLYAYSSSDGPVSWTEPDAIPSWFNAIFAALHDSPIPMCAVQDGA